MPAFSLAYTPQHFTDAASPHTRRSPTQPTNVGRHSFGGVLEPRYIVGAESLDQ